MKREEKQALQESPEILSGKEHISGNSAGRKEEGKPVLFLSLGR
jgi:hypothetical protein